MRSRGSLMWPPACLPSTTSLTRQRRSRPCWLLSPPTSSQVGRCHKVLLCPHVMVHQLPCLHSVSCSSCKVHGMCVMYAEDAGWLYRHVMTQQRGNCCPVCVPLRWLLHWVCARWQAGQGTPAEEQGQAGGAPPGVEDSHWGKATSVIQLVHSPGLEVRFTLWLCGDMRGNCTVPQALDAHGICV